MSKDQDKQRKPKPGNTYKQYRDETTGQFISKEEAARQAGSDNVMTHRVERRPRHPD